MRNNNRKVEIEYKSGKKETHAGYAARKDGSIIVYVSSPNPRRRDCSHEIIIPIGLVRSVDNIEECSCVIQ